MPTNEQNNYPITIGEVYRLFTSLSNAVNSIDGKVDNLVTKSEFEVTRADHDKRLRSLERVEPTVHIHTEKIDRLYSSLWWVVTTVLSLVIIAVISQVIK